MSSPTSSLIAGMALWPSMAWADNDGDRPSHRHVEASLVSDRDEEMFIDGDSNSVPHWATRWSARKAAPARWGTPPTMAAAPFTGWT
jgi:hypothetical protein